MSPAEATIYQAEHARPGAALELMLAAGEGLAISSHRELYLNDDDEAVSVCPSPEGRLYIELRQLKHGADIGPLRMKLPPDLALIILRPRTSALTIRQDGAKRIAFRFEDNTRVRPKPSVGLNALSYLASNQRNAAP